ncbi:MAG: hypothetical protein AAGU27_02100, partial [Dehalobacterium sp.]
MDKKVLVSFISRSDFKEITETRARDTGGIVYFLCNFPPERFRRSFAATDTSLPFLDAEGINLLIQPEKNDRELPDWLLKKI